MVLHRPFEPAALTGEVAHSTHLDGLAIRQ